MGGVRKENKTKSALGIWHRAVRKTRTTNRKKGARPHLSPAHATGGLDVSPPDRPGRERDPRVRLRQLREEIGRRARL